MEKKFVSKNTPMVEKSVDIIKILLYIKYVIKTKRKEMKCQTKNLYYK